MKVTETATKDNSMDFAKAAHSTDTVVIGNRPFAETVEPYAGLIIAMTSQIPEKIVE